MRTSLLDTGPIVAYLRPDDSDHHASAEAIERALGLGGVATIWDVIGEAYNVIRYRFAPRSDASKALDVFGWIDAATILPVEPIDLDRMRALLALYRDQRLSYVDALLLAVAERTRADEVVTLDRELTVVRLGRPVQVTVL